MATLSKDSPLLLGSGSPRRRELLLALELPIRVVPPKAEEPRWAGQNPLEYLEAVVQHKLEAVAEETGAAGCAAILVADTIVVLDDEVLGKPDDVAGARRLLGRIVGRTHTVYTRYAIALPRASSEAAVVRTVATAVTMRSVTPQAVRAYADRGEGLDKAGAYAAQGLGSAFIERIDGSYANVVGLPVCEVVADLIELGLVLEFPSALSP